MPWLDFYDDQEHSDVTLNCRNFKLLVVYMGMEHGSGIMAALAGVLRVAQQKVGWKKHWMQLV